MIKKRIEDLNLNIYEEILDNGLKIFICPMKRHKIDARMTVNFGSDILEFESDGKPITIPAGSAHFLEHKMFNKKNADISSLYEKNGALGNAYTSDHSTVYHFNSPVNFYENLHILLRCVNEPYFTDENVQKEKGIIMEELKASLSEPNALAYKSVKYNSYHDLPYKYAVIGDEESINSITTTDLYNAYNAFYTPNNMHLVVCGNVEPKEVINFVKKYYKKNNKKSVVKIKEYQEKKTVVKDYDEIKKDITDKVCFLGYKVDLSDFDIPRFELVRYLNVLLLNKFSSLSGFDDETFKNPNIVTSANFMFDVEKNYANFWFYALVKEKNALLDLIQNRLNDLTIDEKMLDLIKKNWINMYVLNTDDVVDTSEILNEMIIKYGHIIYDVIDVIRSLNVNKANKIFKKLDFSNKTMTVVSK